MNSAMRVYNSSLPSKLKQTAALIAVFTDGAQRDVPPVGALAWLAGKGTRQIRRDVAELRARGVLVLVSQSAGGAGRTTRLRLDVDALPPPRPFLVPRENSDTSDARQQ